MTTTPTTRPLSHSYSSIKDFAGCPRRYHRVRIVRDVRSSETDATRYGTEVHKAFENFILHNQDLPAQFAQYLKYVMPLQKYKGEIKCEHKMALTADFKTCDFFSDAAWIRGVPDFMALNHETGIARVVDFKTGKSAKFADPDQLELMAALIFAHFPCIDKVRGMLLFVVIDKHVTAEYTREQLPFILSKWTRRALEIEMNAKVGAWNASPSALCNFCPLTPAMCEYRK